METLAVAFSKAYYFSPSSTSTDGGESDTKEKAPNVELYRQRYAEGRDLWTGEPLGSDLCDGEGAVCELAHPHR